MVAPQGIQVIAQADQLSALLGFSSYKVNARFPWAIRFEGTPLAEPMIFSRYYWEAPALVDIFPRKESLGRSELVKYTNEETYKKAAAEKMGIPYMALWGPSDMPTSGWLKAERKRLKKASK